MSRLMERIDTQRPLQRPERILRLLLLGKLEAERTVQIGEHRTSRIGPRLVAVLRQQLPAEAVKRRRIITPASRSSGRSFECVDVGADIARQREHPALERQLLRPEHPPRRMHSLVKVVPRRGGRKVRPEQVHRLLTVQTALRLERKHLHESPRLPQAPRPVVDLDTLDHDREAPKQPNPDNHPRSLPQRSGARERGRRVGRNTLRLPVRTRLRARVWGEAVRVLRSTSRGSEQ